MQADKYHVAIDTSNYTTSIAAVDDRYNIIFDKRILLSVKKGDRGLRQSEALFQHHQNIPEIAQELFDSIDKNKIVSISVSDKPRPLADSYMPVFTAGMHYGKIISLALGVPCYFFSHQEGHLEAVRSFSPLKKTNRFIAFQISGGTSEILQAEVTKTGYDIKIIGGSKDLSFGQLIDRVGVALNLSFPAGPALDSLAMKDYSNHVALMKPIHIDGTYINLSGMENQCIRLIHQQVDHELIVRDLFHQIAIAICKTLKQAATETGIEDIIMVGGVASSRFIRQKLLDENMGNNSRISFGPPGLSADNAVGTAVLAADRYGTTG